MTKYSNIHIYSWEFVLSFSKEFEVDIITIKNLFKKSCFTVYETFIFMGTP